MVLHGKVQCGHVYTSFEELEWVSGHMWAVVHGDSGYNRPLWGPNGPLQSCQEVYRGQSMVRPDDAFDETPVYVPQINVPDSLCIRPGRISPENHLKHHLKLH